LALTSRIDAMFREADPAIASILDRALAGGEIDVDDGIKMYSARGASLHLVGIVADEIRRRKVGDTVTYVVNRNINFTNVCVKQCGFCAFSRDFREEEGYMLPVPEIVRRAQEAHRLGATEVCIQAGLPPDMEPDTYENICRAIKGEIPDIHIHGFSPEEVLYGAQRSKTTIREYLARLKEAGVDTLPGTSAEILDQPLRDKIAPGRITVQDWKEVIRTAHSLGIRTTATMMFGHMESIPQRVRHLKTIRDIQKETGGFTEFVPLNFIAEEAPMYRLGLHTDIRDGAGGLDVLLTHAISRIMLHNIDNLQMSWVKEGNRMSQLLLMWGANDFGGTLINESISTSAGAQHGQLLTPSRIRDMILEAGRRPAERTTTYGIRRRFDAGDPAEPLDAADPAAFGSYAQLIKIDRFRYSNPRDGRGAGRDSNHSV
jgi:FO synthase subunit 2